MIAKTPLLTMMRSFSHQVMSDSVTPWIIACQTPLSMGFPSQENWSEGGEEKKKKRKWSGLPFPSPGDLPHPGIEPASPALAGGFFTTELPGKHLYGDT